VIDSTGQEQIINSAVVAVIGRDPDLTDESDCALWTAADKALWFAQIRLDRAEDPRPLSFMEQRYVRETQADIFRDLVQFHGDADDAALAIWTIVFEAVSEVCGFKGEA
jgi:hypothetical protein